jgi:hypothetical protein
MPARAWCHTLLVTLGRGSVSNAIEAGAGLSDERPNDQGDQRPQIEGDHQWRKQPEPRGVGGTRLVHRLGVITGAAAVVTMLVAWVAFLVYAAAWLVGQIQF